jgi:hypothetical protein
MIDMKRNILVTVGTALVLAFSLSNSRAQNDTPAPTPALVTNLPAPPASSFQNNLNRIRTNDAGQPQGALPGGPGSQQFQRMPPGRFRQPHLAYNRALGDLRMVKMELERAEGDLGGHKTSAIEACEKAIQELTAVVKSLPVPPPAQQPGQPPSRGFPTPAPTPLNSAPPSPAAAPGAPPQP